MRMGALSDASSIKGRDMQNPEKEPLLKVTPQHRAVSLLTINGFICKKILTTEKF